MCKEGGIQLLVGLDYLFPFLSAILYFFFTLCIKQNIYFTFLESFFSVYKCLVLMCDVKAKDRSGVMLHKFKGHLM